MKNMNIISSADYDMYYFDFSPFNDFSPSRLKHRIVAELEKLHPFFGSHCSIDIHWVIRALKMSLSVIVMDSETLDSYRSNSKYKRLYICEEKNEKKRVCRVYKNRWSTKNKSIFVFSFIVVLFFALASFIFLSQSSNAFSETEMFATTHTQTIVENEIQIEKLLVKNYFTQLNNWIENDVVCTAFSYNHTSSLGNDFKSTMFVNTSFLGLTPENIFRLKKTHDQEEYFHNLEKAIHISPITYSDNIPKLNISFEGALTENQSPYSIEKTENYNSVIRSIILQHSGTIQEEHWDAERFAFSIPISKWDFFYESLVAYLHENSKRFLSISLQCEKGSAQVTAEMTLEFGMFLPEMSVLKTLFSAQHREFMKRLEVVEQKKLPQAKKVESSEYHTKMGSIKKADGTEVLFFTDKNGKIITTEVQ